MSNPFPGMDPYLEHPWGWEQFHARLIAQVARQLQPLLDPRYVTSIEQRVYIDSPPEPPESLRRAHRIPDVSVARPPGSPEPIATRRTGPALPAGALLLEVPEDDEYDEGRVEILDLADKQKLVAAIEVLSPTNKRNGPGRDAYQEKQREFLDQPVHLIEIDLLRTGTRVLAVPEPRLERAGLFDYIASVRRYPRHGFFEVYPMHLREPLATIMIPLAGTDADVPLELQKAVDEVHVEARYYKRLPYTEPCDPPLDVESQRWANDRLAERRPADW